MFCGCCRWHDQAKCASQIWHGSALRAADSVSGHNACVGSARRERKQYLLLLLLLVVGVCGGANVAIMPEALMLAPCGPGPTRSSRSPCLSLPPSSDSKLRLLVSILILTPRPCASLWAPAGHRRPSSCCGLAGWTDWLTLPIPLPPMPWAMCWGCVQKGRLRLRMLQLRQMRGAAIVIGTMQIPGSLVSPSQGATGVLPVLDVASGQLNK